jgi:RNA ligase (TIGR02306 family)
MSSFAVKVIQITQPVEEHPNADKLNIVKIDGFTLIAGKLEDGSPRYKVGDVVIYVPEAAVVPDWLLRQGFWDEENDRGILSGPFFNRVKAVRLRGIFSQGILFPVQSGEHPPQSDELVGTPYLSFKVPNDAKAADGSLLFDDGWEEIEIAPGENVAGLLGIKKYEPPIPEELLGDVVAMYGFTKKYDFESIQAFPDLFVEGEEVVATEKLHGTHLQIGYIPGLADEVPENLFFDGNVYCCAKGMGADGMAMANNDRNRHINPYVKMLNKQLKAGLGEKLKELTEEYAMPVRLYGEIHGAGIVKGYSYGKSEQSLALFDIQIGNDFVGHEKLQDIATYLGLELVPVIYSGPFDLAKLSELREGKTTLFTKDAHIREGLVIKSKTEARHPYHGRKIGKFHNPAYLLKATGEEIN